MKRLRATGFAEALQLLVQLPQLAKVGVLGGATALYAEHLENPHERFSFDLDFQVLRGSVEAAHQRLKAKGAKSLRLVSRLNEDLYEYEVRLRQRVIRVELAKPYLAHRHRYVASRHVSGLKVLSLPDLLFAKVSAFSTRALPRDLFDLFSIDLQRKPDWRQVLARAAGADDNDYNPAQFQTNLGQHTAECRQPEYWRDLPVRKPPDKNYFLSFTNRLHESNAHLIRTMLEND